MPKPVGDESASTDQVQPDELAAMQEDVPALTSPEATIGWLEQLIEGFEFDVIGLARRDGKPPYPLPTEPGALAHLIETRAASYLEQVLKKDADRFKFWRGGQRGYPDMELSGGRLGDQIVALDIKAARRKAIPKRTTTERRTQSRIALITGNTYFAHPEEKHANVPRPYAKYAFHLDWVIIFSIDEKAQYPEVTDLEHVVAETWQIASKQRPSSTRNYIGAVDAISNLKEKSGAFASRAEFETYWRSFNWKKEATVGELEAEAEADFDDG